MKLEQNFIKKLEAYLFQDFSDFDKNRIYSFLEEYKKDLNIEVKEKIVIKEIKIYEKIENLEPEIPVQQYKLAATPNVMLEEAIKFCEKHNVSINDFRRNKTRKGRYEITSLRKEFCAMIADRFIFKMGDLGDFFNLHRTCINHYLYGSKYIPITNRPSNLKVKRKVRKSITTNLQTI